MGLPGLRGIVASDLLRVRHAYAFVWFFTMFSRPMVRARCLGERGTIVHPRGDFALRDQAGLGFTRSISSI